MENRVYQDIIKYYIHWQINGLNSCLENNHFCWIKNNYYWNKVYVWKLIFLYIIYKKILTYLWRYTNSITGHICPPNHQVRIRGDPQYGSHKRNWEELLACKKIFFKTIIIKKIQTKALFVPNTGSIGPKLNEIIKNR